MTQEEAFKALAARLEHARREHPVFATSEGAALDVIKEVRYLLEQLAELGWQDYRDEDAA